MISHTRQVFPKPTASLFSTQTAGHKINCVTKTNSSPREKSWQQKGSDPVLWLWAGLSWAAISNMDYQEFGYVGWCMSTRSLESWFTTRIYLLYKAQRVFSPALATTERSRTKSMATDTTFIMGVKKIYCYDGLQAVPARLSA